MKIKKVRYKIFLGFLSLSSIILIVMSMVVKTSYASSLKRNEINSHIQASNRTREQFDLIMGILDRTASVIGSSPEVLAVLYDPKQPEQGENDFSMNVYLQAIQAMQPFLGNISIVGNEKQFCSSSLALRRGYFNELYQHYSQYFSSTRYKDYFVNSNNYNLFPSNAPRDILTGVWPIYDMKKEKMLGQIYLGLNYSIFQEMFILSPTINNEKILIVDSSGNIVYHYPAFISFDSILKDYPQLIGSDECIIEGKAFNINSFIISETSKVVGWRFIRIIDTKYIIGDTQRTQYFFNIVFILSIIISLVFSVFMSLILTKPVKLLFEACNRIESGDLSFRVDIKSNDEMGQLGRTFNIVMDQMNANLEHELVVQKRQNELKLEVLRSQINPHFLYNTLDSIKFLANLQEIHNISSMSAALINLLKYNLSTSTLATLGEEVESVSNYVGIQKYRYGDIFEFKMEIAPGTEDCIISRFVLQPLVENSLIHGITNMESGGEICIRSKFEGEILCLEVVDNGKELSEKTLKMLNQEILEEKPFNSIGINNIRERIRLQFGELSTLVYSHGTNNVTVATLHFPASKEQQKQ